MLIKIIPKSSYEIWLIARPERRNAMGPSLLKEFTDQLNRVQSLTRPPCAIILSTTQKALNPVWMAGGDLKEIGELDTDMRQAFFRRTGEVLDRLAQDSTIWISVVDGQVIGGGIEVCLATDYRIATERSSFHFKQLDAGLATGFGGGKRMVAHLGLARTQSLLFRRRLVLSSEASGLGLVHEIYSDATSAMAAAEELAVSLAQIDPRVREAQKQILYHSGFAPGSAAAEAEAFTAIVDNPQHQRFCEHFTKGRAPKTSHD